MAFKQFQYDLQKNLSNFKKNVEKTIDNSVRKKVKTSARAVADLAMRVSQDVGDQVNVPFLRKSLDSALDLLRPHAVSLGLRVASLNSRQIAVVVPNKFRNCDDKGFILPGVLISAGLEAVQLLWMRAAPDVKYGWEVKSTNWNGLRRCREEVRLKTEISEITRETLFAELNHKKEANWEAKVLYFNEDEQVIGELEMTIEVRIRDVLEWK